MPIRKVGFIVGILSLFLAFIVEVPFRITGDSSQSILRFSILIIGDIEYYSWGFIENNVGYASISFFSIEDLLSIFIWSLFLIPGLFGIVASSPKSNPVQSKKLFKLNFLMTFTALLIFTLDFVFIILPYPGLGVFGFGYYMLYLILTLNIIAAKIAKD